MTLLLTDTRVMAVGQLDDGNQPVWLGSPGSGVLQFDAPVGIAARPDGGFVVADSGNHRLVAFDAIDGSGWQEFGSRGSEVEEFERPSGVAVGSDGRIYVADTGNGRIVAIDDMAGNGWSAFGSLGTPTAADPAAVGLFASPLGIAVDSLDRVAVADTGPGRIVRVTGLDGSGWVASAGPPGPRSPVGIACGAGSELVIADVSDARVGVFPGPAAAPTGVTATGKVYAPVAIAAEGTAGFCLDMGAGAGRLLELSLAGAAIDVVATTALEPLGFRTPRGVCVVV
jgi:DNA-binding beta-propeller fold protein YncE